MPLLRFIDPDGKEQDVADIKHLHELIQTGRISYESFAYDDKAGRWMPARDHELFVRIRNIANQTVPNLAATPNQNRGPWGESSSSADRPTSYSIKKTETTQENENKNREPVLIRGPGYRFMVVSGRIFILAVILCIATNKAGPLAVLFATPILLPIMLVILIPSMFLMWGLIGSPYIPASGMKEAIARNGKFIVGGILMTSVSGILMTSVICAAAVALRVG
jgi:hypothetical protein